tara:strand:+ start:111 stop:1088 length:978 start_codon:yes stop_codon:yes gene_type:complete
MKLLLENWRRFLNEMSFKKDTKTVVGFDFDHTLARTAGGQVAYFDPDRKWREAPTKKRPVPTGINQKYFETNEKVAEKTAAKAELSDNQIEKLLSLARKDPGKARKLVIKYMRCDGSRSDPFWCPSQAQLDFYTQADQWKGLWKKDPSQRPDCWAFDFSSRDILGWEQGTPEKSQQLPVMKAFRKAFTSPGVEIVILTSRSSAVESQIPKFLKAVGAPAIEQHHIKGCAGCDKGQFLYDEIMSNEKDYDIGNLYFYDDSEANVATVSKAIQRAVNDGLIEGEGVVYRVDKHNGSFSVADRFSPEQTEPSEPSEPSEEGEQDETPT